MKQSVLKKIIKEEIKNVLNEITPSPFIKNKFPYINKYDTNRQQSKMMWDLISTEKMSPLKIKEFQGLAGYAPQGYGGPFDIKEKNLQNGTFEYKWYCFSSSD